jgi:hypothetical protein
MRANEPQAAMLEATAGDLDALLSALLLDTHGSKAYCIFQSQPAQRRRQVLLYVLNVEQRS